MQGAHGRSSVDAGEAAVVVAVERARRPGAAVGDGEEAAAVGQQREAGEAAEVRRRARSRSPRSRARAAGRRRARRRPDERATSAGEQDRRPHRAVSTSVHCGGRSASLQRRLRRRLRRVRVGRQQRVGHPPDRVLAAVARRERVRVDAAGGARRAVQPDVEMVVVVPPGPDLAQPGGVAAAGAGAERELDRGGDEDALDPRVAGRGLEDGGVRRASSWR